MVTVDTYWAKIFIGFKNVDTGFVHFIDTARNVCSKYVNKAELCVTLSSAEYIYSHEGSHGYNGEQGAVVGLINYPRFPTTPEEIQEKALELAGILKKDLEQHRVTVMFPDKTVMLGESE